MVHPDDLEKVQASIQNKFTNNKFELDYVEYRIIQKDRKIALGGSYGHFMHNDRLGDIFMYLWVMRLRKENVR